MSDLRQAAQQALEALEDLVGCPYEIDQATVPKAGIDAAPSQVVGTMSVALVRHRKARAGIAALRAALEAQQEPVIVGWRPAIKCVTPQNFNAGAPREADVAYWKAQGCGIEYAYAAAAVAAALTERHALQARGEHPAPCARQCEAQAFRGEIAAEQRRSEMYADLVRRTAEALGQPLSEGWHKMPERVEAMREANERFGKRQGWWTDRMFSLEQDVEALRADIRSIAAIAHNGGLVGIDPMQALALIRALSLAHFDRSETTGQASASARAANDRAKGTT